MLTQPVAEEFPRMRARDVRQTGIRLKLRILLTLVVLAVVLAIGLVLLLGDPWGTEQQGALGNAVSLQAQTQALALNHVLAQRQQQSQVLAQALARTPDPLLLQVAQHSDASLLACLLVTHDGQILLSGQDGLSSPLVSHDPAIPASFALLPLVQQALLHRSVLPAWGGDGSRVGGTWLAWAAPVAPDRVLLSVFSWARLLDTLLAPTTPLPGAIGVVLDTQGHVAATVGTLPRGRLATIRIRVPGSGSPLLLTPDPLTGQTDLVVSAALPGVGGRYLVLVDAQRVFLAGTRDVVAGHNTPLLLLGIVVLVVFVATWFALPIIRPIRRTTRVLEHTTSEVRTLSIHAQTIAHQHTLGVNLLTGASQHLERRRDAILRDTHLIALSLQGLSPHLQLIQQAARVSPSPSLDDAMSALKQALTQVGTTARSIELGLKSDQALTRMTEAMHSAHEISAQFETASVQLAVASDQLGMAAASLL